MKCHTVGDFPEELICHMLVDDLLAFIVAREEVRNIDASPADPIADTTRPHDTVKDPTVWIG